MATKKPPWIDLYHDSEGQWRWRFVAGNGKTLADSGQGYADKRDAIRGLELVTSGTYELTYRYRLDGDHELQQATLHRFDRGDALFMRIQP
jgi:uncharacterized protein YegP (UPF0339 family)